MRIEPLTTHPIVKVKPVKNDNQKRRHQEEDHQQKQQQHVEEKEDGSPILHIDEII